MPETPCVCRNAVRLRASGTDRPVHGFSAHLRVNPKAREFLLQQTCSICIGVISMCKTLIATYTGML